MIRVMDGIPIDASLLFSGRMSSSFSCALLPQLPEATLTLLPSEPAESVTFLVTSRSWGRRCMRSSQVLLETTAWGNNPFSRPSDLLTNAACALSSTVDGSVVHEDEIDYDVGVYLSLPPCDKPDHVEAESSRSSDQSSDVVMEDVTGVFWDTTA